MKAAIAARKCERCGKESDNDWTSCPSCGQEGKVETTPVGAPGSVGPAMANGSDITRNSDPKSKFPPELSNPGRPPGEIIEGTGG
jgi:hypothetical protein